RRRPPETPSLVLAHRADRGAPTGAIFLRARSGACAHGSGSRAATDGAPGGGRRRGAPGVAGPGRPDAGDRRGGARAGDTSGPARERRGARARPLPPRAERLARAFAPNAMDTLASELLAGRRSRPRGRRHARGAGRRAPRGARLLGLGAPEVRSMSVSVL